MDMTTEARMRRIDRTAIRAAARADEATARAAALENAGVPDEDRAGDRSLARRLVAAVHDAAHKGNLAESFLSVYKLSTTEGVVLMCLAEALLRVPDARTADKLIEDKVTAGDWATGLNRSQNALMNASAWALMLTGRLLTRDEKAELNAQEVLRGVIARLGEPVAREALKRSMQVLARQFVMGETIDIAMKRAKADEKRGVRYSYDMLGEAARTEADARRYIAAYERAVDAAGAQIMTSDDAEARASISVKLSALHPRFEFAQGRRVLEELAPRLVALCVRAREKGVRVTIDAEEADRLEPTLDVIEAASTDSRLLDWDGFGAVVQAYQKRALAVVGWAADLARHRGARMPMRLVKGAYWDTEVKRAQMLGLADYPVFTRKENTDLNYLACAKAMFAEGDALFPAFATHNALTIAAVMRFAEDAGGRTDFEFQRLHGMGEALYEAVAAEGITIPCRVYAPVGSHRELLAYLVRRLLENGANSSFVNQVADANVDLDALIVDPRAAPPEPAENPSLIRPRQVFAETRKDFAGFDLADPEDFAVNQQAIARARPPERAGPIIGGEETTTDETFDVVDPATGRTIAQCFAAGPAEVEKAMAKALKAQVRWDDDGPEPRAKALERAADLMEERTAHFMAIAVKEAGKTLPDALAEVREAVDFLRYYATEARRLFSAPTAMPGPTGETNELSLGARGVFGCISPWNFPLAIFTGQVAAALAAGNAVLAKPAEQTPLIAFEAVKLLHEAGVPGDVLAFLPGDGPGAGAAIVGAEGLAGIAFTGGTETARLIHRALAQKDGPIATLIAETGGANAMIVDSTALPEQVTRDVLASSFQSAGQRCSALRTLFLQRDVADDMIAMIAGAAAELTMGDPSRHSTDVGPIIDRDAQAMLREHADAMAKEAKEVGRVSRVDGDENGFFFAPRAFELPEGAAIPPERFGPILHVIRYRSRDLDAVIDRINATRYGLTLGVHSRVDATANHIARRVNVGNVYVNRNQIGAIVGSQPFGGRGLSGTGPKAGGPHYLLRFATEKVISTDTTAAGGNASLMTMN